MQRIAKCRAARVRQPRNQRRKIHVPKREVIDGRQIVKRVAKISVSPVGCHLHQKADRGNAPANPQRNPFVDLRPYGSLTSHRLSLERFNTFFRTSTQTASKPAGIQIQRSSFCRTAKPRSLKKRVTEIGETTIGRHGRKYRVLSNGEKNATPNPPLVIASRNPWLAVATQKYV